MALLDSEIASFVNRDRPKSWYERHYTDLHQACLSLMYHGVRYDSTMAKEKFDYFIKRKDEIKIELFKLTGVKLWSEKPHKSDELVGLLQAQKVAKEEYAQIPKEERTARKAFRPKLVGVAEALKACRAAGRHQWIEVGTGLSDDKIIKWFVGLGVKVPNKRRDGGKMSPTVDDIALKRIRQSRPNLAPVIILIHEHRKCNTLIKYVDENKVDDDGRIRCQYKTAATQNARLSSSENPLGTGTNLQNFDRTLKVLLLPDKG